jgi:hypothetical protein
VPPYTAEVRLCNKRTVVGLCPSFYSKEA